MEQQKNKPDFLNLRADCGKCFGLCCTALYFSTSEGFPSEKEAGIPCSNLQEDFRCRIHDDLGKMGLKGCLAYDCFGAGQKVAQKTYNGHSWRAAPESAAQMFEVFLIMCRLHEMLWYLTETKGFQLPGDLKERLHLGLDTTERLTSLAPQALLEADVAAHGSDVGEMLTQVSKLVRGKVKDRNTSILKNKKNFGRGLDLIGMDLTKANLRGLDLSGSFLIAASLSGADLNRTDIRGADMRDTDIRNADLSRCLFATQAQINSARGNQRTGLPERLVRPLHWENDGF